MKYKLTLKHDKQIFDYHADDGNGTTMYVPYFSLNIGTILLSDTKRSFERPNYINPKDSPSIKTEWRVSIKGKYYWIDEFYFDVEELSEEEAALASALFD